jgi:alpha-D-ribose 1-methylphosphonate 5-triphosphate synthase subunit PhnI
MKRLRPLVLILALLSTARMSVAADSSFAIQSAQPTTDGGFAITWRALPGRTNQVMYTDSLSESWQDLPGAQLISGTNDYSLCYTDQTAGASSQRFYRIRAPRNQIVLSLVLDRSGSMLANGGAALLPPAVRLP